jgi:hypothetical protein
VWTTLWVLLSAACSNVPPEVVDLSNKLGEDMAAVHASYRQLINEHYDNIRQQRVAWFDNTWAPSYVKGWIADGRLVDMAAGKVVYDPAKDDFLAPTKGREGQQLVESIYAWADAAVFNLAEKRKRLIEPIDKDEQELLASVDEAFARFFRGNAVITAHLNSLRNVQGKQDDLLRALDLKDLRLKINKALEEASNKAVVTQAEVDALEKDVEKGKAAIDKAKATVRKR